MPRKIHRTAMLLIFCLVAAASAQPQAETNPSSDASQLLEQRVNFWVDVYSRYGERNLLICHLDYPWVVFAKAVSSTQAANTVSRIKSALRKLAAGGPATEELEQHLENILAQLPEGSEKYQRILDNDLFLIQAGQREHWKAALQRSGRYEAAIQKIFAEAGLPSNLARMPLTRSFYDESLNTGTAAGLWLMPTDFATRYLTIDPARDERLDALLASQAAARYFKEAYQQLQSWPLAVSAFGQNPVKFKQLLYGLKIYNIQDLIDGRAAANFDFETRNAYAKWLAALKLLESPSSSVRSAKSEPPVQLMEVPLAHSFSAAYISRELDLTQSLLKSLNPALTPPVWEGELKIPKGYRLSLPLRHFANLNVLRVAEPVGVAASLVYSGMTYRVREGDTLLAIAKKYGTSFKELKKLNALNSGAVKPGQDLIVRPGAAVANAPLPDSAAVSEMAVSETVVNEMVVNEMVVNEIAVSETAASEIAVNEMAVTDSTKRSDQAAAQPETINAPIQPLPPLSSVPPKRIVPAEAAKRESSTPSSPKHPEPPPSSATTKSRTYQVRSGETLWSIGRELGISVERLKRNNNLTSTRVAPGQILTIPTPD